MNETTIHNLLRSPEPVFVPAVLLPERFRADLRLRRLTFYARLGLRLTRIPNQIKTKSLLQEISLRCQLYLSHLSDNRKE